jgi:LysM repeat protein
MNGAARALLISVSLAALSACSNGMDFDLRGLAGGFTTADAARGAKTTARPQPDARGVISYPTYQVAVARDGESIAEMATRLGLGANELGRYNGIPPETKLRSGEIIALPRRVDGSSSAPTAEGTIDVTTLAGNALDRVGETGTSSPGTPANEPVRHQVQRGETAYSIAKLYNVPVRALADWNSLDSNLSVREGQYLLIPTTTGERTASAEPAAGTGLPGGVSVASEQPTTETALPAAEPVTTAPATTSSARMVMPVDGTVTRQWEKGKSDGIFIAAAEGSPVRAAADGTVAKVTKDTSQVTVIVIRHANNVLTVYVGVDQISVKKGDKVAQGQIIAKVAAGNPPFVQFQVREGITSVDPMGYLK